MSRFYNKTGDELAVRAIVRRVAKQPMRSIRLSLLALTSSLFAATAAAEPWLLIDTQAETLTVMGDAGPVRSFDNIAVGIRGVGIKQKRGDETTPLGSFRVGWINPYSRFRLFFGLDYPNLEHAMLAYHDGRIDEATFDRIRAALARGESPPQNTPLGGQIGIHGVGNRDQFYHDNTDWTNGCIALNNDQIDELATLIAVGTTVEIR